MEEFTLIFSEEEKKMLEFIENNYLEHSHLCKSVISKLEHQNDCWVGEFPRRVIYELIACLTLQQWSGDGRPESGRILNRIIALGELQQEGFKRLVSQYSKFFHDTM